MNGPVERSPALGHERLHQLSLEFSVARLDPLRVHGK